MAALRFLPFADQVSARMTVTIEDMLLEVADGQEKRFLPSKPTSGQASGQYLEVKPSHKYQFHRMDQPERADDGPRRVTSEIYLLPRIGLSALAERRVKFQGYEEDLTDLYQWGLLY